MKVCDTKFAQKCKWTAKTTAPENNISSLKYFIHLKTVCKGNHLLREAKSVFMEEYLTITHR